MAIRQTIEAHFNTNWSKTAIAWDNVDFDPKGRQEFVRFSYQDNIGSQMSLGGVGNRLFRHSGFIFIQVLVRRGAATKRVDELADDALNIFEGNEILGLRFINCTKKSVTGIEKEWFQVNVVCEFSRDIIK